MISYGRIEWIPEMKKLWHQTFGDTKAYLDAFFSKVYKSENTLVYTEHQKVRAILFMVPYQLRVQKKYEEIVYLYALATAPAFRGKKIMTRLIDKAAEISKERGYAAMVLIPSGESLFQYYSRFGFHVCSSLVKISKERKYLGIENEADDTLKIQEAGFRINLIRADAKQIWNAYKNSEYFTRDGIVLSEEQNAFYYEELKSEGGAGYVFDLKGELDGYVLLNYHDCVLEIYETNIDAKRLTAFYEALEVKYQYSQILFYQPICFDEAESKNNKVEFAMALNLTGIQLPELFINRVLM